MRSNFVIPDKAYVPREKSYFREKYTLEIDEL